MKIIESEEGLPETRGLLFTGQACGKCKAFLKAVGDENPSAWFQVDVDASKDIAMKYDISAVPTLVVIRQGKPEFREPATSENFEKAKKLLTQQQQQQQQQQQHQQPNVRIRPITEEVSFAPQLSHLQLENVHTIGFKSVLNIRKAGEAGFIDNEEKLLHSDIKYELKGEIGDPDSTTKEQVELILNRIEELPKPLLVHCKGGYTAGTLSLLHAALQQPEPVATPEFLKWCQDNGCHLPAKPKFYDLVTKYLEEKQKS